MKNIKLILCRLHRIVIITTILVAATASAISSRFDKLSQVGGIIGTSVSAAFLLILGLINILIAYKLIQQLKVRIEMVDEEERQREESFNVQGGGCMVWVLRKLLKGINRYVITALHGTLRLFVFGFYRCHDARKQNTWPSLTSHS